MKNHLSLFATSPKGIELLLAEELKQIGAGDVKLTRAGVAFSGSLKTAYKACLWLRTANRVLLPISTFEAKSAEQLYDEVYRINWADHLDKEGTLAVDFNSSNSEISHSQFGALKVKDAIVDQFRAKFGSRPSVNIQTPDVRINVYVLKNQATISIDLSGDSLHRRGYRKSGVEAPLKENLAAAILLRANWPDIAKSGGGLIDPMCGSGTIPIEAAMIAANSAPGLLRDYFGFLGWKGHRPKIWEELIEEAEQAEIEGMENLPFIAGYDANAKSIANARNSGELAGFITKVHFEKREFATCLPHPKMKGKPGLFIVNPPYGIRLGEQAELKHLYSNIGMQLTEHFPNWNATVFTGNAELGKNIGIRAYKKYALYNGAIACTLLNFQVEDKWFVKNKQSKPLISKKPSQQKLENEEITMFSNRVHKNLKKLKSWLSSNNIQCFRVYDKDIPEFAVSIDIYGNYVHVQEYKAPDSVDPKKAQNRLGNIVSALPIILNIPSSNIHLKVRQKQQGRNQYQKKESKGEYHEVVENNCRFLVNFTDYLDTGLFLDHRPIRQFFLEHAAGKSFLNLFSYTATATVCAAKGGAKSTVSVDFSKRYNTWAKQNLALNGFSDTRHQFFQDDCVDWINNHKKQYDLIFLDPPTFSNSKTKQMVFDIQKDHVSLITNTVKLLKPGGLLVFSNNFRKFKIDSESLSSLKIENITPQTIPLDFKRNHRIHNCWKIKK
ncbi:MAG: bifunctional 23S rRNA (guanine(2069)-N(7))-methyltransferase RlmK/23S rRNA (guanine(2445)-N(2))-methyltransferase RlmL [Proteobacteria bacterium]|nr:bifunctional 23S rRNA (guanine(2069)-N(7))-methyltransferase RlmK/23S rRNA (guanine(2445)-N(2))-methyltransferase RlmL [Pseudomonadota bacterium]